MRIGILGTRGIPNAYGGFEQFAQFLSGGLARKGHDVTVYNSSSHPYKESRWEQVEIIHCADPENNIGTVGQFIYDYNCLTDARRRNFDVLLQLGYTSSSVWYRYWPKNAINVVNMDGLEWKRTKYNNITQRFLQWAEKLAANNADVLIADSTGIQDYIRERYQKQAAYIPYGAEIPKDYSRSALQKFDVAAAQYYLVIARMEPENNVEMVIQGYHQSQKLFPLIIVGSTQNKYGKYLTKKYGSPSIRFPGAIYEPITINALRHFSALYFHGHSVGGTNPSLLEAMACGSHIAAHDNVFNKAILTDSASYFSTSTDVTDIIDQPLTDSIIAERKQRNVNTIRKTYNWSRIIDDYETIFLQAKKLI